MDVTSIGEPNHQPGNATCKGSQKRRIHSDHVS